MPDVKQFFATNNYRTDDSGYSAFETLGRRVGGQYDQAGNDLRDIGRAKAATINMLGRWPFNILELEKRESLRYAKMNAPAAGGSGSRSPAGGFVSRPSSGSVTDSQFATQRMPNLAALNEMAEGAGRFGSMVGGSQLPYLAQQRGAREAQQQREQDRRDRAQRAADQKEWDLYEKGLSEYNKALDKSTREWADKNPAFSNTSDENSPYYSPSQDYGGFNDPSAPTTVPPYGGPGATVPTPPVGYVDKSGTDYGSGWSIGSYFTPTGRSSSEGADY